MRRFLTIILALALVLPVSAQQRKTTARKPAATTSVKKKKTTPQRKTTTQRKTTQTKKKTGHKQGSRKKTPNYSTPEIQGLKNQRSQIQNTIKKQQHALSANKADVQKRLQNLLVLNGEIETHKKAIEGYQSDIRGIDGNINMLNAQLSSLEQQLKEKKLNFVKSMRYMTKHRNIQDKMMFVFSSKSLTQAYRRMRFVREYAAFQRMQGEQIKVKQAEIDAKNKQLASVRSEKNALLYKGQMEQTALQNKQSEQQNMVKSLQNQQKTIQGIIAEQQKKQANLNAQIDRLVAIEVEKARQRAIAEAKRKAEAEAAARKKRAEELARKKAEAEARERENQRRIAEAKEKERKMKELAAANKNAQNEQAAREAESARRAVERKAEADRERSNRDVADAKRAEAEAGMVSSVDRKISGSFANNRGRLPMPVAGSYRIVSHFGQYNVEGLRNVKLDNKGINIKAQPGAAVRSIFDGEVSFIFNAGGQTGVIIRHGSYISVYVNLRSVSVRQGQKVSTRQTIGVVGDENILHFQLRQETTKLNPEVWLGR